MKNRIKGYFLTLLMLFGCLYPSGQAFANGTPPKIMSVFDKEELVNELAKSNYFVDYIINLTQCSMIYTLNSLVKPKEEIERNKILLADLQTKERNGALKNEDKIKLSQLVGYSNVVELENVVNKIEISKNLLFTNHSALNDLSKQSAAEVMKLVLNKTVFKENLKGKLFTCKTACYKAFLVCIGLSAFYAAFIVVAFIACIATALLSDLVTGGLVSAFSAFLVAVCIDNVIFGVTTSVALLGACNTINSSCNTYCN